MNDSGQVVGMSFPAGSTDHHAFLYDGITMRDLGTLGGSYAEAYDINNSGQVVGYSDSDTARCAFLYDDGKMVDLNTLLPAYSGWLLQDAKGINDLGQIVGSGYINGEQHAYLLTSIPEPATLSLLVLGAILARRKGR